MCGGATGPTDVGFEAHEPGWSEHPIVTGIPAKAEAGLLKVRWFVAGGRGLGVGGNRGPSCPGPARADVTPDVEAGPAPDRRHYRRFVDRLRRHVGRTRGI